MTSRRALDAWHGRQGGRVVSWHNLPPPPIGSKVRLELGEWGRDVVTVITHGAGGRIGVRFDSGAELTVNIAHTSTPEGTA